MKIGYNWNSEYIKDIVLKYFQRFRPDTYEIVRIDMNTDAIFVLYSTLRTGTEYKIISDEDLTNLEKEVDKMLEEFDSLNSSSNIKLNSCSHNNKKHIKFNTFEYDYCPDCKKEIE